MGGTGRSRSRLAALLLGELPERFALVGFSWGGTIGCHIVAQAPERVAAIVLVDVDYQTPPLPASYEELLEQERAKSEEMRFSDSGAFIAAVRPHFSTRITDAQLLASMCDDDGALVPELTLEVYAAALHGVQAEPPQPLLGAVEEAELPVLLLVAGQPPGDERMNEVETFRRAIPRAEVLHFAEAGHSVLVDAAGEAIPAVGEWLVVALGA